MKNSICKFMFAAFCAIVFGDGAAAQGGWNAWDVFLLDGTQTKASPLTIVDGETLTRCIGEIKPACVIAKRAAVNYIAFHSETSPAPELPPAPVGDFDRDLVVKSNGERSFGAVTFKKVEWSAGKIVQDKVEIDLKDVAYIKFAAPKQNPTPRSPKADKNRTRRRSEKAP